MFLQLIIIILALIFSTYFYIKHRNLYSGILFFVLVLSVLLYFLNLHIISRIFYWLSLILLFVYPFIFKKEKKVWIILYVIPLIVDEIFRIQHYPMYLIITILFVFSFILYVIMAIQYNKYKTEFSFLTLMIGLNLITLLKSFHFL